MYFSAIEEMGASACTFGTEPRSALNAASLSTQPVPSHRVQQSLVLLKPGSLSREMATMQIIRARRQQQPPPLLPLL